MCIVTPITSKLFVFVGVLGAARSAVALALQSY
jgi:hypothetical protein